MLTKYIEQAMSHVIYEPLPDNTYCGRLPECPGVIAFGGTLDGCQQELKSVLEGWLLVKLRHGDQMPIIGGIDLNKGIPALKETAAHG